MRSSDGPSARAFGLRGGLLLVLALLAFALVPASAFAGKATVDGVEEVSYVTAVGVGTVEGNLTDDPYGVSYYSFEYSTDKVHWNGYSYFNNPELNTSSSAPVHFKQLITGLKGGTHYYLRIEMVNFYNEVVSAEPYLEITTLPVTPPKVLTTDAASEVAFTKALATGSVERPAGNPDPAFDVNCNFEYVTDAVFKATGFEKEPSITPCDANPIKATGSVKAQLTELIPGTTYHLRMTASNGSPETSTKDAPSVFTTVPVAVPPVTIETAANVGNTSAAVKGTVGRVVGDDPALDAECRFEYISAAAYGSRSEKDKLTVSGATSGNYYLGWEGQYGPAVPYNAPAKAVQEMFESFIGIPPGSVNVSGGPGSLSGSSPYLISFVGPLANKSVGGFYLGGADNPLSVGIETTVEGHNEGFEDAIQVPCEPNPVTTAGTNTVKATLTELAPNTTYHLRLWASNKGGPNTVEAANFKTTSVPGARTLLAGSIHADSVTLGGRVNPANSNITYQFEWGPTDAYGNLLPAEPELLPANDSKIHVVTLPLSGLSPATVYHYRILATNTQTGQTTPGEDQSFETLPAVSLPQPCPNESSRTGHSAGLPDCRVYEWVTPGLNGSAIVGGRYVSMDGNHIWYGTLDAPDDTDSAETLFEQVMSNRDANGWHTKSLMPPITNQVATYGNTGGVGNVSEDFKQTVVLSKQPLAGGLTPTTGGVQYYYHPEPGVYIPITTHGNNYAASFTCCPASGDFTHVFYQGESKQKEEDPLNGGNYYEWSDNELRLLGWLPSVGGAPEKPAPEGATLAYQMNGKGSTISYDGTQTLFKATGYNGLFLRSDGKETTEISASQRTVDPDPKPTADARATAVSEDGTKAMFVSASELTNDAYTGREEGTQNDKGADLYLYDIGSKKLTDLTVDTNPEDKEFGTNIQQVVGHTEDFSFVYFIARGNLAAGGVSGAENLYVWHDGQIDFIASGPVASGGGGYWFYNTPDGRYAAFELTDMPTAYDNVNPKTHEPMSEVFKYTYKGALECVSCRPSAVPPIAGSNISGRAISEDGSKVFFYTSDAILPESTDGLLRIYEYSGGQVQMVSPQDADADTTLIGTSVSGDDLFFQTIGELTPGKQGKVSAIYDARVGAVNPPAPDPGCQGENCRSTPTVRPNPVSPGSATFQATVRVAVSESKPTTGKKTQLRVIVPEAGDVTISGKGLKALKKSVSAPGSVTLTVSLTPGADKRRLRKGVFTTDAQVVFASSSGNGSRDEVSLKFKAANKKKSGK